MPKFKNCLMDTLYYDEAPWWIILAKSVLRMV